MSFIRDYQKVGYRLRLCGIERVILLSIDKPNLLFPILQVRSFSEGHIFHINYINVHRLKIKLIFIHLKILSLSNLCIELDNSAFHLSLRHEFS